MVNLDELNESQREAVTTTDGPVLVIAGAGSGKTRTLVYRVAHLVDQGVPPESVLLLTFTRKAGEEMLRRAGQLLGGDCRRVVGGTFHSVANMLLRRFGAKLGFSPSFSIIDRGDAEGIVNLLKSSRGIATKEKRFPTKRAVVQMISGSVNKAIPLDVLVEEQYSHLVEHLEDILQIAGDYEKFKVDHGLMDYDDLLVNWRRLLIESEEVRERISGSFSHLMVDEYQDTNVIQADIVRAMASADDNVMVVGDDSQSIYSFRGADFYNIIRFPEAFPDAKLIKLEENYRSTQPILRLTNNLIDQATEKYSKSLFSRIKGEIRPKVYAGRDEQEEAVWIVEKIQQLAAEGVATADIAVLFRSGFHSYKLELELTSAGFDYEKRGGLKLTESAHIKDLLAFLRVLVNHEDTLSWSRILLQLEGVGPVTAQKISTALAAADDWLEVLQGWTPGKVWQVPWKKLVQLFVDLVSMEPRPGLLYEHVIAYYQPVFERLYADDYPKRQRDLEQVGALLDDYGDLQSFLDDTALDPPDEGGSDTPGRRLVLSTIHSAKGLEFEAVFVLGLAEGRFPRASAGFGEQLEEERRLLYVAATRAKRHLFLTWPRRLMTADRQWHRAEMSPFLAELEPGLYERVDAPAVSGRQFSGRPVRERPLSALSPGQMKLKESELCVGQRVTHPFFGDGCITLLKGGRSIEVQFDRHGAKTLHLDYARLSLLS